MRGWLGRRPPYAADWSERRRQRLLDGLRDWRQAELLEQLPPAVSQELEVGVANEGAWGHDQVAVAGLEVDAASAKVA